jgi:hypothetical protein
MIKTLDEASIDVWARCLTDAAEENADTHRRVFACLHDAVKDGLEVVSLVRDEECSGVSLQEYIVSSKDLSEHRPTNRLYSKEDLRNKAVKDYVRPIEGSWDSRPERVKDIFGAVLNDPSHDWETA